MKEIVKKSMLYGLVGVPVFVVSVAVSNGIIKGVSQAISKHKKKINNYSNIGYWCKMITPLVLILYERKI